MGMRDINYIKKTVSLLFLQFKLVPEKKTSKYTLCQNKMMSESSCVHLHSLIFTWFCILNDCFKDERYPVSEKLGQEIPAYSDVAIAALPPGQICMLN